MAYTPKYISTGDIPVQVPDDYDNGQKLDAIELAESLLELELHDGDDIPNLSSVHEAALKQRATCELVKGAEDPDDVALSDLEDDGDTKSQYAAQSFCDHYQNLVDKMKAFKDQQESGPYVYSTSPSDDYTDWKKFENQIDVPISDDFARRDGW